ncbi:MAG: DUF1670 domain-containing protein [Ignavibacteria bacterium]|nr:DUF1670 domain-containing protein [Ignavibacteria bacterium]
MNNYLDRQQHKTSEGEFIYELEIQYGLCPKMRDSILDSAKKILIRDNVLSEGEIEVSVISIEERSGKIMEKMKKTRVRLTIDSAKEDIEVLKEFGRMALRQVRIQRITQEAIEQNGVLSQEDLSKYLGCDVRTIKRCISEIKKQCIEVITRGVLHNIGRGQTHKSKIVGLYLEGKTYSDIKLKTRHSVGAIKRYMESFVKVLMSYHNGIREIRDISSVTGLSDRLVRQYLELLRNSRKDRVRRATMDSLISQWKRAGTSFKKRVILGEFGRKAVHMMGGVI